MMMKEINRTSIKKTIRDPMSIIPPIRERRETNAIGRTDPKNLHLMAMLVKMKNLPLITITMLNIIHSPGIETKESGILNTRKRLAKISNQESKGKRKVILIKGEREWSIKRKSSN